MKSSFILAAALMSCTAMVQAQAVTYDAQQKQWFLQTDHSTYVIGINERNELQSVYWGAKLTRPEDLAPAHSSPEWASFDGSETTTNTEYPGWGGRMYAEPSLKVTLADGVRDLVLKYGSYKVEGDTLAIELKDIKYDLVVTLTYRVYPAEDIVRKSARIENKTDQPITIESAQSGVWYVPRNQHYRLTYAAGSLGGRGSIAAGNGSPGLDGSREPAREYQPPDEPVVRSGRKRKRRPAAWKCLVRGAGVER